MKKFIARIQFGGENFKAEGNTPGAAKRNLRIRINQYLCVKRIFYLPPKLNNIEMEQTNETN